jgi:hypothetical protein
VKASHACEAFTMCERRGCQSRSDCIFSEGCARAYLWAEQYSGGPRVTLLKKGGSCTSSFHRPHRPRDRAFLPW